MTDDIKIALSERALLEVEIEMLADQVNEQFACDDMMPENIKKGILIRLSILDNGLKFIDNLIAADLKALPLSSFNLNLPVQNARA